MKKFTTIFLLSACSVWLQAQIIITNATFPTIGDTLKTAIDNSNLPIDYIFLFPGGDQHWDFSALSKDIQVSTIYRPAIEGEAHTYFSEADMVILDPSGTENYYNVSTTSVRHTGIHGIDPLGILLPIEMNPAYIPPLTERFAPLMFFDIHAYSSGVLYPFLPSAIPSETLSLFPFTADSFRLRAAVSSIAVVDAYGMVSIPGATYEVLREKRTTYTEKRLDAKIPPLGWLDVTDNAVQFVGLYGLGIDTLYSHWYLSATEKEPIVIVDYTEPPAVIQVQFLDLDPVSTEAGIAGTLPQVILSPMPAYEQVRYECRNFPSGAYVMQLYDAGGDLRMTKRLTSPLGDISLDGLDAGMYFYQVLDENNRAIAGGKLAKTDY